MQIKFVNIGSLLNVISLLRLLELSMHIKLPVDTVNSVVRDFLSIWCIGSLVT